MNLRKILVYGSLLGAGTVAGAAADQYLSGRPVKQELARIERDAGELRDNLGRCYSNASKSYVVNPDMTVTIWDIDGGRKVKLSGMR